MGLRGLLDAIRSRIFPSSADRDLEDELRFHLEHEVERHLREGAPPEEARRRASLAFGGMEQVKEECREERRFRFLETLRQDLGFSFRILAKAPGFAAAAILTLGLGIGANTAIFAVVDRVLLSPPPYPDPGRLVAEAENDSLQNITDIRRETRTFAAGGGVNIEVMDFTGGHEPVQIQAAYVDAGLLDALGASPLLGRTIAPGEDVKGGPRNVVLTHHFWQSFLGGDPAALGKTLTLSGSDYTVIGILPAEFALPREHADVFVSLWVAYPEAAAFRGVHFMHAYWRLKKDATLRQARADMAAVDGRLASAYPDNERGRTTHLVPLGEWLAGDVRTPLLVLWGAVLFVLLIACANCAALLTARAIARRREFVVRAALGAGRSRLVRQTLTESLVLSAIGGLAGLLIARWGTEALLALKPAGLGGLRGLGLDAHVFAFVFVVSSATSILFGLAPAWSAAHGDLAESLRDGAHRTTAGPLVQALRRGLVVLEFGLALILLVGAGLLMKGFSHVRQVRPGFNPENVTTVYLQLPPTRYAEIPRQTALRRELLARLNALPGLEAAMVTDVPFGGGFVAHSCVIAGRPPIPVGAEPEIQTLLVMGDYFRVMQIPLRAGRTFDDTDREGEPPVAILNEEAVRRFFPNENPLGARIDWGQRKGDPRWMTIVGVVRDVKHSGLDVQTDPAIYSPFAQSDEAWRRWMTLVLRGPWGATRVGEVKRELWSLDGEIPLGDVRSMEDLMGASLSAQRFNMTLLGTFAALALLLAAVGIYGVMAQTVGERTREIGVHIALGAQREDVLRLVLRDGARLAMAGIALGVAGAFALTRVLRSLLFDVTPTDPGTFAAVVALLVGVAAVASYLPARRAMRVDPVAALRD